MYNENNNRTATEPMEGVQTTPPPENGITAGTITRTALLLIALINQIAVALGYNVLPIDNDLLVQGISVGFTIVMSVITWWKNQSFTRAARKADSEMKAMKKGVTYGD